MTYIEKQKKNGKEYYYLVKNVRLSNTSWKKIRKYFGKKKPTEEDVENFYTEIMVTKAKYLSETQVKALLTIKKRYAEHLSKLSKQDLEKFKTTDLSHFAYNTSAIEGSSMTLPETGYLLEENMTPKGKDLWEIHSALNTREAMKYVENMNEITHSTIKKLHKIVMRSILEEELGEYRSVAMRIGVARHRPPLPSEVPVLMNKLLDWYNKNKKTNVFELASLFHIKFEGIHPFRDGNGRVGRLLINFILKKQGFPLLDIPVDDRVKYYQVLDIANVGKKFKPFVEFAFNIYVKDSKAMGWI